MCWMAEPGLQRGSHLSRLPSLWLFLLDANVHQNHDLSFPERSFPVPQVIDLSAQKMRVGGDAQSGWSPYTPSLVCYPIAPGTRLGRGVGWSLFYGRIRYPHNRAGDMGAGLGPNSGLALTPQSKPERQVISNAREQSRSPKMRKNQ